MGSRISDLIVRQGEIEAQRHVNRGASRAALISTIAGIPRGVRQLREEQEERENVTRQRDLQRQVGEAQLENVRGQNTDRAAARERAGRITSILSSDGDLHSKFGELEQVDPEFSLELRNRFANATEAERKAYGAQGDAVARVAGSVLRLPQNQRKSAWAREISKLQGSRMIEPREIPQVFDADLTDDDVNAALQSYLHIGLTARDLAELNEPLRPFAVGGSVAVPDGKGGVTFQTPPPRPDDRQAAPGSFEDYLGATPERRREIETARGGYYRADNAPAGGRTGGGRQPVDDGTFPQGVRDYLMDLKRRGYTREQAEKEVFAGATWSKLKGAHPRVRFQSVRTGVDDLWPTDRDGIEYDTSASPAPAPPPAGGRIGGPPPAPPPSNGGQPRRASTADVRAVAERLGISEAEARRQLEARGVLVQ